MYALMHKTITNVKKDYSWEVILGIEMAPWYRK